MSADAPMPSDSPDGTPARAPLLTDHAIERWVERVCCEQDGVAPWDLEEAFERAVSVGIPGPDRGRLHAPTGAVFVFKRNWSAGPPVLVTVLYADRMGDSLRDDHLKPCPDCGLRFNEGVAPCPWCADGDGDAASDPGGEVE